MASTRAPCVILNNGHQMPVVGLGTFAPEQYTKEQTVNAVKVAIDVGYRHIDTAFMYQREVEVGQGINAKIADGTVKRDDIFCTGKLWNTDHAPERVRPALERSLKDLQLDYLDLYLIHTPIGLQPGDNMLPTDENGKFIYYNTNFWETWKVECNIFLNQSKLLEFCKSKDIVLVAYSVLGSSRCVQWHDQNAPYLLEDPLLNEIANRIGRTPAQVAMRYLLQRGIVVLAKSFNPERIEQNFQVFDFEIGVEDKKSLDGLNQNYRYLTLDVWRDSPNFPYNEEY